MQKFCKIYKINYIKTLNSSTFQGKLWWGDQVSKNYLNGINKKFENKIDYSLFAKIKEWYVVYDNDFLATTNQEIKIKLSELCYHSIPNYHVDDFIRTNKKNESRKTLRMV